VTALGGPADAQGRPLHPQRSTGDSVASRDDATVDGAGRGNDTVDADEADAAAGATVGTRDGADDGADGDGAAKSVPAGDGTARVGGAGGGAVREAAAAAGAELLPHGVNGAPAAGASGDAPVGEPVGDQGEVPGIVVGGAGGGTTVDSATVDGVAEVSCSLGDAPVDQTVGGVAVDGGGNGAAAVVLPEPVRQRVLALAADALGRLPAAEVPPSLRPAARFTAAKRARLAAAALAAALEADTAFRLRAAEQAEIRAGSIVEAVRTGVVPAAADPIELAAAAYLLRPSGWPRFVERAREALDEASNRDRRARHDARLDRLQRDLEAAKSAARAEAERNRASADAARAEADTVRRQLREQTGLRRAAERARGVAEEALAEERRRAATAESAANAELRRLRQRLAEAEDAMESGRRVARESRQADEARLWLLLDTLGGAVQGLRRELALTPSEERPADAVAADGPRPDSPAVRGDDPERLDRLLELPRVHLVVDGYNVTKSGYGELPLATQRSRLIGGLGALAARTGAEVSCVFDGGARPPAMPPAPRGLRVLFSQPGEPADDVIRRLVAAEPSGRPIVVVSSDREVAEDVRRAGAYPVDSVLLLRRLDRG